MSQLQRHEMNSVQGILGDRQLVPTVTYLLSPIHYNSLKVNWDFWVVVLGLNLIFSQYLLFNSPEDTVASEEKPEV